MPRTIAVLMAGAALVAAPPAAGHSGSPNYLSEVESAPEGIVVEVLNRDDRLLLTNRSGEEIVIDGYDDEPYARIAADGTVEVNRNSPAYYLNEERFGGAEVPEDIDPEAAPDWEELDTSGRFEWHDHRAHWMGKDTPPQVTDPDTRTRVFDWSVPTSRGAITGTLFWTPDPGAPVAFIVMGSAVVLLGSAAALIVRRRRDRGPRTPEAW